MRRKRALALCKAPYCQPRSIGDFCKQIFDNKFKIDAKISENFQGANRKAPSPSGQYNESEQFTPGSGAVVPVHHEDTTPMEAGEAEVGQEGVKEIPAVGGDTHKNAEKGRLQPLPAPVRHLQSGPIAHLQEVGMINDGILHVHRRQQHVRSKTMEEKEATIHRQQKWKDRKWFQHTAGKQF